jgi:hypothetical protein
MWTAQVARRPTRGMQAPPIVGGPDWENETGPGWRDMIGFQLIPGSVVGVVGALCLRCSVSAAFIKVDCLLHQAMYAELRGNTRRRAAQHAENPLALGNCIMGSMLDCYSI